MNLKLTNKEKAFWLIKNEPSVFSINDLRACPEQTVAWDGVRNYQARNFLRKMRVGDQAFFYHSRCHPPAVVGVVNIVRSAYPDPTQFDPNDYHFDAKSSIDNPRWSAVDVQLERTFLTPIPLAKLKSELVGADFPLIQRGSRLSVMPVPTDIWEQIMSMAGK